MQSETLPVPTQPDEPSDVTPCHTGAAAKVCGRDVALLEVDVDTLELMLATQPEVMGTCISCGAEYGQSHYSWCEFKTVT